MVNAFEQAIKSLWNGICTVHVRQASTVSSQNGRNAIEEVILHENIPCRISYTEIQTAEPHAHAHKRAQKAVLYIAPNITIPAGSKITITQEGVTEDYERSGVPAVYPHHQEVPLELFKGWA